jgi:tetratricopeptide (TPR) repeat protein
MSANRSHLEEGMMAFNTGAYEAACIAFTNGIKNAGVIPDPNLWLWRAFAYANMNKPVLSINDFNEAMQFATTPAAREALHNLIERNIHIKPGSLADSFNALLVIYRNILREFGQLPDKTLRPVEIDRLLNSSSLAFAKLIRGDHLAIHQRYAEALTNYEEAGAERSLKEDLKLRCAQIYPQLAQLQYNKADYSAAVLSANAALKLTVDKTKQIALLSVRAKANYKLGRLAEAVSDFSMGVNTDNADTATVCQLGQALLNSYSIEAAYGCFVRVLAQSATEENRQWRIEARMGLVTVAYIEHKWDDAIRYIHEMLAEAQADERYTTIITMMAHLLGAEIFYAKNGAHPEALAKYRQTLEAMSGVEIQRGETIREFLLLKLMCYLRIGKLAGTPPVEALMPLITELQGSTTKEPQEWALLGIAQSAIPQLKESAIQTWQQYLAVYLPASSVPLFFYPDFIAIVARLRLPKPAPIFGATDKLDVERISLLKAQLLQMIRTHADFESLVRAYYDENSYLFRIFYTGTDRIHSTPTGLTGSTRELKKMIKERLGLDASGEAIKQAVLEEVKAAKKQNSVGMHFPFFNGRTPVAAAAASSTATPKP